ncbi:hypothetical protein BDK51DRAFT_34978 [Blyttiomyces helicus]|uniref:Uncharacterized protein n=1 Tax=Blyttiomyces helicus TaxID=388810 RepID=A0A4P9W327_9FUNG|nr:hypothetical protein BDK51DRAFT_34978 [Blyttiomyces helicus]|eukprot:RKO86584.1 hypothetical protein BDK51DRAFT_34978 [Blyttiomyces helicus]
MSDLAPALRSSKQLASVTSSASKKLLSGPPSKSGKDDKKSKSTVTTAYAKTQNSRKGEPKGERKERRIEIRAEIARGRIEQEAEISWEKVALARQQTKMELIRGVKREWKTPQQIIEELTLYGMI